jgi:hypothetical protein
MNSIGVVGEVGTVLRAALQVFGKATVTDADTGDTFEVHEMDGQVVVLERPGEAAAELAAAKAIERAKR